MRSLLVALLAVTACSKSEPTKAERPPPPAPVSAAVTTVVATPDRKPECDALLARLEQSNRTGVEFGVANKADGGDLTSLWRGFARLAGEDARAPSKAKDPTVASYERRFVDIRTRSVPAFEDLASATAQKDPTREQSAGARIAALREEWLGLERDLRLGCAPHP